MIPTSLNAVSRAASNAFNGCSCRYFAGLERAAGILREQYGWRNLNTVYWSSTESSDGCEHVLDKRKDASKALQVC